MKEYFESLNFYVQQYCNIFKSGDIKKFNRYINRLDKLEKWRKQYGKLHKRRKM